MLIVITIVLFAFLKYTTTGKQIREINESGVTIFLIEHIMQAVVSLCEEVIVLHHGEKIAEGTPEQVMNDPYDMEVYLGKKEAAHA